MDKCRNIDPIQKNNSEARHQETRRKHFFLILTAIGIMATIAFCIVAAMAGNQTKLSINIFVLSVLIASLFGLKKKYYIQTYTLFTSLIALSFLLNIVADKCSPTALYWIYVIPSLAFFFLGRKIGGLVIFLTTLALVFIIQTPGLFNAHLHEELLLLRFFITYFFVLLLAWRFESTRIQYEEKLREQHNLTREQKYFLETLLETLPTPVFFKDIHGKYIGCNKSFEKMLNLPRSKIIGKTVYDMGPKAIADKYFKKDKELLDHPGTQTYGWTVAPSGKPARQVIFNKSTYTDKGGHVIGMIGAISDITDIKESQAQKEKLILELETALGEVKTLSGLLPICSSCKKIRDDKGYWNQIEGYIQKHSQALFSHGICPDCATTLYGKEPWFKKLKKNDDTNNT